MGAVYVFSGELSAKINNLVQEGKSKKAKVKRKNAYFVSFLAILNG
ncbi:MAG: hypothetical protein V7K97_21765 [Nostoc sp.]